MSRPEDQRIDPRYPVVLRVDFPDQKQFLNATENLSASGLFIRTDRPFLAGERVPLAVSLRAAGELQLVVEVVWLRPETSDAPAGVGVRIPADDADGKRRLGELIAKVNSGGPPVAPDPSGFRVLIVEDNPHIVEMYAYALKKLAREMGVPLEVATAADGHQAFTQLKERSFQLVVTDLYMPVLDGFGLVQKIREDGELKRIPLVVISAGGPEAQARVAELGVDVYLRKPVRFTEVLETVKGLLKVH